MQSPLLTDQYQLAMIEAYLAHGEIETAVFEFFVRELPPKRGFLVAAGLEQAIEFLEVLQFSQEEIDWLKKTGNFSALTLDYLAGLRFTGDVHAMAEGTVFFPNEPILRVTAPLPEAQLVEARLINLLHFETLIASKAARMVLAAPGKGLLDFGLRRAHGAEAGILAARASYIAGFEGTATGMAAKRFGIPVFGTMAHSYIQAHDAETVAFERFARARPQGLVLLLDTYDTEQAARKVVGLAPKLREDGIEISAVRLDSGDLLSLSRSVRNILDDGNLSAVTIFASGGLDEYQLKVLIGAGAPIDGFGIGTSLTTSSDAPALDCAYKLQEYAGRIRRKQSTGKETWPGRKQIWRSYESAGTMAGDVVSTEDDQQCGEALIMQIMSKGKRVVSLPALEEIRAHAARQLQLLPELLRGLTPGTTYPVEIGTALNELAAEFDEQLASKK